MKTSVAFFTVLCLLAAGSSAADIALLREDLQLTQPLAVGGALAVGDFNRDGRQDLVVGTASGLAVMLNSGHATFGPAIFTGLSQPAPVALADFNNDGWLDLAASGQIALGRGDGTFLPPRPTSPTWFVAESADFNQDGKTDLAAVQPGACGNGDPACSVLIVLLGNGDGTFRSGDRFQIAAAGYKPAVADFNQDGKRDLAVSLGRGFDIFLGNGDGSFKMLSPISPPAGPFPALLLAGDLNGDKFPDLVSRAFVFLGRGDGTFQPPVRFPPQDGSQMPVLETAFALDDFDGDGRIDVATVADPGAQFETNWMRVFLGRGDGTFSSAVQPTVGWGPRPGVAADFDGDGLIDLVVPNWLSNSLSLLLSKVSPQGQLRAVSAAEGTGVVAPGSLATLYPLPLGVGLREQSAPLPWPTTLSGVTVQIDDGHGSRRAPLLYVSQVQINFQVPQETSTSDVEDASIVVSRDGAVVQTGFMRVASIAPTLFIVDPFRAIPAAINTVLDAHGVQTASPVFDCDLESPGVCGFKPVSPSAWGSYVTFYGTGFRGATTANVQCWISGQFVKVEYAGPQGTPGLDQINIRLPDPSDPFWEAPYVEVRLSINGTQANMAVLALPRFF